MSKVIAGLDTSLAANPVLRTAVALGEALGSEVEAVHVTVDGDRVSRSAAGAAGVPYRTASGPVVDRLVEIGRASDVVALVLGARGSPFARRPMGGTALAVATALSKPVVVVPPEARVRDQLRSVLVPLAGRDMEHHTPRAIVALAEGEELDVIVLHVLDELSLPSFTDQPQHEHEARVSEFLRRYCPWGIGKVRFEVRIGRREELVPIVADEMNADIVALGWAQELEPDRSPVVRTMLMRGTVPLLLVPVRVTGTHELVSSAPAGAISG
jgi:nucleotide-binding universal stress UspA family protein